MIHASITNVIGPAVTTLYDDGWLAKDFLVVLALHELEVFAFAIYFSKGRNERSSTCMRLFNIGGVFYPRLTGFLELSWTLLISHNKLEVVDDPVASLSDSYNHAETEFSVVLEQAVGPSGTLTTSVHTVRVERERESVNGSTTSGIGDDHSITEHAA